MFRRKYWIGLTVFLVAIVGVGLYYLQTRPSKDPIVIIKPVEPLPKSEVAEVPEGDTSQGGHRHADGTWHGEPHAPVEQPTEIPQQPAAPNFSELPELPDDIDPDDIPAFSITGAMGEVYHYDRPLTPEEREMYYTVKAEYPNDTPSTLKALAVNRVRKQKIKAGALHPFLEDRYKGVITDEELDQRLDEFFERTR